VVENLVNKVQVAENLGVLLVEKRVDDTVKDVVEKLDVKED
jgi:hypothetical protein